MIRSLNLMRVLLSMCIVLSFFGSVYGQACNELSTLFPTPQPGTCQVATSSGNLINFFTDCRTVCLDNTGVGNSGQVTDLSCVGGNSNNDLYIMANDPYAAVPGYDGSLVFKWVDWPNKNNGAFPPYFAVHVEVKASFLGVTAQSIDCTDGFAVENQICLPPDSLIGNQTYLVPGSIPTLAELDPIVDATAGLDVNTEDVAFWIQLVTSDGAQGPICFEVSPYEPGFLCGDATSIPLSGGGNSVTGSASSCLCSSAVYGGLANTNNNVSVPCGTESLSGAWFTIEAPYACNKIEASLGNWAGQDDYNITILKDVSCPGKNGTNGITGKPQFTPGATLQPGYSVVASTCSGPAVNDCSPVPQGTYHVYVSGVTERAAFDLNINVTDVQSSAGTASSAQNGAQVCSGTSVDVSAANTLLPLNATCGQDVAWFTSTNIGFNPYNGAGTYLASGTSSVTLNLPPNNTCNPIIYYIKGIVADDGSTPVSGCRSMTNTLSVTVYPEIGNPTVLNTACLIIVAGRCNNFTVNGKPGSDSFTATFADDSSSQNFIISNGLAGCNVALTEMVSCSGNCTQPVATGTAVCDPNDPFNYYVDVSFQPGSAATYFITDSDGGLLSISGAGTYRAGPFRNNSSVSITVENTDDINCNLPLGLFSRDCNTILCPNLTSAVTTIATDVCEGSQAILQATVDQGIINQDFTVQWKINGVDIPGANTLVALYNVQVDQSCVPEGQVFSCEITCLLPDGTPSSTPSLNAGTVVVYPRPKLGVDFAQDPANCAVKPVDLCGGLDFVWSPIQNNTPGSPPQLVSYTASVPGAPVGCNSTGFYYVNCPGVGCSNTAGDGDNGGDGIYCIAEGVNISTNGASIGGGYALGWARSDQPPYNDINTAVRDAIASGNVYGPFAANNSDLNFTNGVDLYPGEHWFTPFVSLDVTSLNQFAESGTVTVPQGVIIACGQSTKTIDIPFNLPYCENTTFYTVTLTVGGGTLIDNVSTDPPIPGIVGTSDGTYTSDVNWNGDPSGVRITIEASSCFPPFTARDYNYSLSVTVNDTFPFPTICPVCDDKGMPVAVDLLPSIILTPPVVPVVCQGDSIDLTTLNPQSTVSGDYTWYTAGSAVLNYTTIAPMNNDTFFVELAADADTVCTSLWLPITFSTIAPPVLNAIPPQPSVCLGDPLDLTLLESGITTDPGTFVWYKGDPDNNGVRLPDVYAKALIPIDGQDYFAVFQDLNTGCEASVSTSFTVLPLPPLNGIPLQNTCDGDTVDITAFEPDLTTDPGTFAWYIGDPNNGGTLLSAQDAQAQIPNGQDVYFVEFIDSVTGCSSITNVQFNIFPAPQLASLPVQGPLCDGDTVDLAAYELQILNSPGTYTWFYGDPDTGSVQLTPAEVNLQFPVDGQVYYTIFVDGLTGCDAKTSIELIVDPLPVVDTIPNQRVCEGEEVNLTLFEASITNEPGFFIWYGGDPDTGATAFTTAQATAQLPADSQTYYVVFTSFNTSCGVTRSVQYFIDSLPKLDTIASPQVLCAGETADLIAFNLQITNLPGTFDWYLGNPNNNGVLLNNADIQGFVPNDGDVFFVVYTQTTTGCQSMASVAYDALSPLTGSKIFVDCQQNLLVIDLSTMSGGAGGYQVAGDSPNDDGDTILNGEVWEVILEDSVGCRDTLISKVNCVICDAGEAVPLTVSTICCNDQVNIQVDSVVVSTNRSIAWAITTEADGPITDQLGANTANDNGDVFIGNSDFSLDFEAGCNRAPGNYYLTPFIVKTVNTEPVVYDTLNNCVPVIEICPNITGTDWELDPMILTFPDGSTLNVNDEVAFGLPITQALLDAAAGGSLPCIRLDSLYFGDPNGTWDVSITNTGTGDLNFSVPDFQVVVLADSCAQLGGTDQVTEVKGITGIVGAGTSANFSFEIPPVPDNFPEFDPICEDYGEPILITLKIDSCDVGINDISTLTDINVYPNPFNNHITIVFSSLDNAPVEIRLSDVVGRMVHHEESLVVHGKNILTIAPGSELASGLYILELEQNGHRHVYRMIK